jgi:GT2 family glycosyltransferase
MPLPAVELLSVECRIKPAWAVFDAAWYLRKYPDLHAAGIEFLPESILAYYLETGCRLGHSPSPLFDELFYLSQNPDVAELVVDGSYRSGFDHFCQHGHRGLSPHWLFNDTLYAALYDDMSLENLDVHGCYGRYDHYLKSGQREDRMAQFLFDQQFYKARATASHEAKSIDDLGPFVHFLYCLESDLAELPPSIYFDPAWYVEHHARARAEIENGQFGSAIEHYLRSEAGQDLDPVPEFSEQYYRSKHPDVAAAIDAGVFRNGYQHFIQHGAFELRPPSPAVDLIYYRDANPRVRDDLNSGFVRDAFAHLLLIGLPEGLAHKPPDTQSLLTEDATKQFFLAKAKDNLVLFGRHKLDFKPRTDPVVSVIMVLFDKFELTMQALASLRNNYAGSIELILVDNASSDDTRRIDQYVAGAKIFQLASNIGFLGASNHGLEQVTADLVLFLNNDIELGYGAIEQAIRRLRSDRAIAAVGGKVIRTHGRLQEAGCVIWNDGSTIGYMRDASPLAPEANFVRDVDFCSGVFLLCQTSVVKKLGGFDGDFSPAYYEEVDLCVQMAEAGYRVVYDPAIVIHHLEYGSAVSTEASMALMRRGHKIFERKHKEFLKSKQERTEQNLVAARAVNNRNKRVLFIEDTVPVRRIGSGFVRANDAVNAIAAAGYDVSVFPVNGAHYDIMSMYADFHETVEVLHDRDINGLQQLLDTRPEYYDLIWVSRTHNLGRILPIFQQAGIDPKRTPFILDTEAVVTCRDAANQVFRGPAESFDFDARLRAEFEFARDCRHITAVNQAEADMLRQIGFGAVSVLGTIREPEPTPNDFGGREGLLFVAGIHQADSPNLDSLNWFLEEILPALASEMPVVPVLNYVGYTRPDVDMSAFSGHPNIKIHGPVGDLRPFYNQNRLFIAPTRYAAGTPYKVYETASYGLPCVATELLVNQLNWKNGTEILSAPVTDAKRFAAQIARLYGAEPIWAELRRNALARLAAENTAPAFNATVENILTSAFGKTKRRRLSVVA